jgi:hypothetical protein
MSTPLGVSILISENWHAKSTESAYALLETSANGLSQEEVEKRVVLLISSMSVALYHWLKYI